MMTTQTAHRWIPALLLGVALAMPGTASAQATAAATPATAAQPDAQTLMVSLSDRMLKSLADNRAALKKDPSKVFGLIDAVLLPSFDADYAGRLVMGTHYRAATPEQRKRFTQALYRSLVKTYGGAIIDFTADRVKFLPFQPSAKPDAAIVRSVITRSDGTRIPVSYSLRQTPAGWMVWDVVIEGISYVRNYRNDLGAEIGAKGIDAVIARLEADGAPPATAPAKAAR